MRAQVAHRDKDFVVVFAQTDHQARFGWDVGIARLEAFEQGERTGIVRAWAGLEVEAWYGFEVVVKNVRHIGGEGV